MTKQINITDKMLSKLGINVEEILGPQIILDHLSFSVDKGRFQIEVHGTECQIHPEIAEAKATRLLELISERLDDDWDPRKFKIFRSTLNGRDLDLPEMEPE